MATDDSTLFSTLILPVNIKVKATFTSDVVPNLQISEYNNDIRTIKQCNSSTGVNSCLAMFEVHRSLNVRAYAVYSISSTHGLALGVVDGHGQYNGKICSNRGECPALRSKKQDSISQLLTS